MPVRRKDVCRACFKKWINPQKDAVAIKVDPVMGKCGLCLTEQPIYAEVYREERY
jgi:hypothetical protein